MQTLRHFWKDITQRNKKLFNIGSKTYCLELRKPFRTGSESYLDDKIGGNLFYKIS